MMLMLIASAGLEWTTGCGSRLLFERLSPEGVIKIRSTDVAVRCCADGVVGGLAGGYYAALLAAFVVFFTGVLDVVH